MSYDDLDKEGSYKDLLTIVILAPVICLCIVFVIVKGWIWKEPK
jgi:hypothetical protein